MNHLTIYPKKELRKKLDKVSKEENRSLNNLVITILMKYFEGKKNAK